MNHVYTIEPCFSMGLEIPNAWRVLEDGAHLCRVGARITAERIVDGMTLLDAALEADMRERVVAE